MSLPLFDTVAAVASRNPVLDDTPVPVAPARVRMAPSAIEARRSGRAGTRVITKPSAPMLVYRDALRAIQPATDHEVSAYLRRLEGLPADSARWGLSSCNGRRGDWLALDLECIVAVDRVKVGGATRARWQIVRGRIADTALTGQAAIRRTNWSDVA